MTTKSIADTPAQNPCLPLATHSDDSLQPGPATCFQYRLALARNHPFSIVVSSIAPFVGQRAMKDWPLRALKQELQINLFPPSIEPPQERVCIIDPIRRHSFP